MTPEERKMLSDLADKFAQTAAPPKDAEAEEFIRAKIGSRPDALYMMTQTVLIQNLALQEAQRQIQELQQRSSTPAVSSGSSFLGQQQTPPRPSGYSASSYSQGGGQQYAAPAPPPPQYAAPTQTMASPSGAPSFLQGAAQTAAGVAAGAFAFEAINSLFSHPGYGGGGYGGFGGGGFMGGGAPVEETVVNNYYDSPQDTGRADERSADYGRDNDVQNADLQNADDQGQYDDSAQYDDASYSPGDDGGGGFDDNSGGDNFV